MSTPTLALSPQAEAKLRTEAAKHCVGEAEYAAELIESALAAPRPLTGAEAVAYWEAEGVGKTWS